jgi:prepilin-type N-terminal cleavage/methylation domain-containing protein
MFSFKKISGFTIVELLIVIVVIGILAAITIIAFSGIQSRAKNSVTISTMKAYQTALSEYVIDHGSYPTINGTCLGGPYKDYNADGIADCGDVNQTYRESVSTTFNNQMKQYLGGTTPNVNVDELTSFGSTFVGGYVNNWTSFTVDGVQNPYYMMYILAGNNVDCGSTVVATNSFPTMTKTNQKYSWSDNSNNSTTCVVALPNPS